MICYMERSTTYHGFHFINQPLSSFILRLILQNILHMQRVDPASVGRKRFSPQTLGLLHRTSPEAYDLFCCCSVFLTSLKDWFDCSYVEGLLVPFPRRILQSGMSPGFSLCAKPLLSLLVSQHFAFQQFVLSGSSSETIVDIF